MRIGAQNWIGETDEIQQPPLEFGYSELDPCDRCGGTGRNAWISADQHLDRILDIYLCAQCVAHLSGLATLEIAPAKSVQLGPKMRLSSGMGAKRRFLILKRDGYRCQMCGATAEDARLHVDHKIARATGGSDDPENLWTLCEPCNLGKGVEAL